MHKIIVHFLRSLLAVSACWLMLGCMTAKLPATRPIMDNYDQVIGEPRSMEWPSPNGQYVCFRRTDKGVMNYTVVLVNVRTREKTNLLVSEYNHLNLTWSPDSKYISVEDYAGHVAVLSIFRMENRSGKEVPSLWFQTKKGDYGRMWGVVYWDMAQDIVVLHKVDYDNHGQYSQYSVDLKSKKITTFNPARNVGDTDAPNGKLSWADRNDELFISDQDSRTSCSLMKLKGCEADWSPDSRYIAVYHWPEEGHHENDCALFHVSSTHGKITAKRIFQTPDEPGVSWKIVKWPERGTVTFQVQGKSISYREIVVQPD